ncbi:MAG TPA: RNA-binding protein, partial [Chthoniobacterales bacterium]|nr:RNA-binding protein [Chthoniobacterales bacterium]
MKLYVGNLSFETTENDLQDLFEKHGTVNEVHLMMDRMTGKSRGFAFITMGDATQGNAAMSALNGQEL